jgi:hypothetical protein
MIYESKDGFYIDMREDLFVFFFGFNLKREWEIHTYERMNHEEILNDIRLFQETVHMVLGLHRPRH